MLVSFPTRSLNQCSIFGSDYMPLENYTLLALPDLWCFDKLLIKSGHLMFSNIKRLLTDMWVIFVM